MSITIKEYMAPKGTNCRPGTKLTTVSGITIHNTGNSSTGANADSHGRYLRDNATAHKTYASWHYCVDSTGLVSYSIPENEVAYHSGTTKGNQNTLAIEICMNSDGDLVEATNNGAQLCAQLLKKYGFTKAVWKENLFQHNDWSGKNCPQMIRAGKPYDWQTFVAKVNEYMGAEASNNASNEQNTSNATTTSKSVNVTYKVRTEDHGWLPEVLNDSDYAGYKNSPIMDVAIKVNEGSVKYRVHVLGGGWLPYVTGYNTNDAENGFAGNGQRIDAIEVYYNTPDNIRPYKKAKYRVKPVGSGSYYSWQYDNEKGNGQDGYAGMFGKAIAEFQLVIV